MEDKYTAKFIKKVTTVTSPRKYGYKHRFHRAANGKYFQCATFLKHYNESLKIGSTVYIAKLRKTLRNTDYQWDVYEIKIPQAKSFSDLEGEYPQTWFGSETCIVISCSKMLYNKNT